MEVENSHDQKSSSSSSSSNSILKKLERYLSSSKKNSTKSTKNLFTRSRSWHLGNRNKKSTSTPNGYFSVYVGSEKQRFVVKTEHANHPLFKKLLEDAELEYGYKVKGPLLLPCEVDIFYKVLAEMDIDGEDHLDQYSCGYGYGCGSPFSPARRLGRSDMAKGCSSYGLLTPPRLLKMNNF